MTVEERDRTITDFGTAAFQACEAGFDMVEIHGAGGYLLCQFLSSFTNKIRPDQRNDLTERTVFPLTVLREIKRRLPDRFPIDYRLIARGSVRHNHDVTVRCCQNQTMAAWKHFSKVIAQCDR
ncbi:MAG: hypothetical protein JRF56_13350 [Deltaproteobacteria bacterium]|nr:hypothetical protein [Deltaproteobacteria bacterium]